MAESHVITALVAKYSELSGRLKACEHESKSLKEALSYLNHTIRLFQPEYDVDGITTRRTYRRRNPNFNKGNHIRVAMNMMRESKEPLSAREIARLTLESHGISKPDTKTLEDLRRGLNSSLMQRVKKGTLVVHKDFYPKRFSVASNLSIAEKPDV